MNIGIDVGGTNLRAGGVDEAGHLRSRVSVPVEHVESPEALLLKPARELVAQACYSRHVGKVPRIVTAVLGGDAGLLGAASLGNVI